jgi:hypothetical protein
VGQWSLAIARLFGLKRRGASSSFGRFHAEDDEDFHKHHLDVEEKYLPAGLRQRRNAGTEKGCGSTSPLSVPPPPRKKRFGLPLVLSRVHWVEPKLGRPVLPAREHS